MKLNTGKISGNTTVVGQYLPFGESFISQRINWATRYTFSAKEKDEATGYHYFGARYYDSENSVWLSVDLMSDIYPSTSPYAYVENNPVMFIDPNGMFKDWYKNKHGDVIYQEGHAETITVNDEKYKNIGSTYTHKQEGINYHYVQDEVVSITGADNDFGEAMQNNNAYQHAIDVARNHSSQTVQEVYNERFNQSRSDLSKGTLELMSGIIGGVLTVESAVSIYAGIRGLLGAAKSVSRIKAGSLKEFKTLVKQLSKPNSKLSQSELNKLRKLAKKYGGSVRVDTKGIKGSGVKPHVHIKGLGKSIENRHIWLKSGGK